MKKYEFTIVLSGSPELTDDLADTLFAAGCVDGSPDTCSGVLSIDVHREADSLEDALRSAIDNAQAAGVDVARVEISGHALASPPA